MSSAMEVIPQHVQFHVDVVVDLSIFFALEGRELAAVWSQWAEELAGRRKTSKEVLEDFDTAGTCNSDGVFQDVSLSIFRPLALLGGADVHGAVSIEH